MSDSATPKPLSAVREWGRNNDESGSAFSGIGRGKRGGGPGRGITRGGRGGRGGASFRARGRGRGSGNNGTTITTTNTSAVTSTVTKPAEVASKPSTATFKAKLSETTATPKNTPLGKTGGRRRSNAKTIPQITVPPPSTSTSTTITDEVNALVEHVRAGALTPNGPITPFTPSHIDWAGDEEEDGSLPDLDDWGVNTSSGGAPSTFEPASTVETTKSSNMKPDAISPILVEGLKSLPEPKVPEHPEPEADVKAASPVPYPERLNSKQTSPSETISTSTSSSLYPSFPHKPSSGSVNRPPKNKLGVTGSSRDGSTPRPPRTSRGGRNNLAAIQPGPESSHDINTKNTSKPVSGGVSLSTPTPLTNHGAISLTPPESPTKGLTDSMHAPKPGLASAEPVRSKANIPASLNINGGPASKVGSYVPPHTRNSRPAFVPTPAPPPSDNGSLTAEFTFPSLSPSPISGHYPTGPRGPGGGGPSESAGSDRPHDRFNGRNGAFNGNGSGFNPRYNNHAPRHYQQDPNHAANHFSRDRPVHQPQTQSHHSDPLHPGLNRSDSPHHTPRHTPHHSREHSASRPVITGDAISKLARTIAGSPAKA
ncbi:hypothetical protein C8J55DRAFT_501830 [Lentinula edodes]|uniref:Uncharacterized protein n=1 Tax=Lentinula lateritia TaxID=40482 RepID=A0A9W9DZD3_9AGAR|nr:hypothetical protein C8J55DRAFT_501830 [Lentinula edodes]